MPRPVLSILSVAALVSKLAFADQPQPTPLVDFHFAYPSGLPYQVYPDPSAIRGPQTGYNICNSTTQNPVLHVSNVHGESSRWYVPLAGNGDICNPRSEQDFCLWGPPDPDSTIGDTEGEVVAWCTQSGRGTRLIPIGTLQGAQLLRTSSYIQIVGFINQVLVDIAPDDVGGLLDPHGSDQRGNPIGGLMYSNAFPSNAGNNDTFQQVIEWTNVMGNNMFCMTICDPTTTTTDQLSYCDYKYDRLNCAYNMPNNAQQGVYEVCDADLKTPVGVYTNQDGYTLTWTQPRTGPVEPPYTPTVPSSSNCVTYQSTDLYGPTPIDLPSRRAIQTPAPGGSSPAAPAQTGGSH